MLCTLTPQGGTNLTLSPCSSSQFTQPGFDNLTTGRPRTRPSGSKSYSMNGLVESPYVALSAHISVYRSCYCCHVTSHTSAPHPMHSVVPCTHVHNCPTAHSVVHAHGKGTLAGIAISAGTLVTTYFCVSYPAIGFEVVLSPHSEDKSLSLRSVGTGYA